MVSRLWPLEMKVAFDDGPFELGQSVDLTIELTANRDSHIREARVDLVCEERYLEIFTVMVPVDNRASRAGRDVGNIISMRAKIPKKIHEEHVDTYVHSQVVFLENTVLQSGATHTYKTSLQIDPAPPAQGQNVTVKWRLVAKADIALARDVSKKFSVELDIPPQLQGVDSTPAQEPGSSD